MTKKEIKLKDNEWKKAIRKRDKRCIICGSKTVLQSAHIFSRAYRTIRWDVNNGCLLCRKHHIFWLRSHPIEFTWILIKIFGSRQLKKLFKKIPEEERKKMGL